MPEPTTVASAALSPPAYARFSRRFRALCIDIVLFALAFYVGAIVTDSLGFSDTNRRFCLLGLVLVVLAYDPVLVALFGGTVGHRLANLRVVDDRNGRNLSLPWAVVRAVVKDALGWLSFATMAITRRHQALHDVLTRSTVQIRDTSRARIHHYAPERAAEPQIGVRSRVRRVLVIITYIIVAYFAVSFASAFFLSQGCLAYGRCSNADAAASLVAGVVWVAAGIMFIIRGWKGRLWGCRRQVPQP
jgi:hypothetical protein